MTGLVGHRKLALVVCLAALAAVLAGGKNRAEAQASASALSLVAVGDSIPYGQSDCGFCLTFVDLYGKALARATGRQVSVQNLSEHTGIDSHDLRAQLRSDGYLRGAVAHANAITVTIGHNDPPWNNENDPCDGKSVAPNVDWQKYDANCLTASAATFERNLNDILRSLRGLRQGRKALIRVTDDYNDNIGTPGFPASANPPVKRFYDTYSRIACKLARTYDAICIDTYHAFNGAAGLKDAGRLLASDHTHPSAAGHRLIARLLAQAGYRPLRP